MRPVVAISCDRSEAIPASGPNEAGRVRPVPARVMVSEAIVTRVREAGMEAVLLPPGPRDTEAMVRWVLDHSAAVVITGGHFDIHPNHYDQEIRGRLDRVDEGRTALELALAAACLEADHPVLGLCGGMQALAVAAGGSLHQDIAACVPGALQHEQPTAPTEVWHPVSLSGDLLRKAYGTSMIRVNSTHHQAVDDPGSLEVAGRAPDGVIEAVQAPDHRCAVGLQWHPEYLDVAPFTMLAHLSRR
jgi:putative glutamine amidotransferase